MTNQELELSVNDELFWDPKIDNAAIAVSADDGAVTLRGTVGSYRQKREAEKAAERVYGVVYVNNDLDVQAVDEGPRKDADMCSDVLQAFALDSLVPSTIDATVKDGFVTLTGTAVWQYERDEAEFVAGNVLGVLGVEDDVTLDNPTPDAYDVQLSIKKALQRDAKIDADNLTVQTMDGTVTLTGDVGSWSEHDAALAAAWAAPGVTDVDDEISVRY